MNIYRRATLAVSLSLAIPAYANAALFTEWNFNGPSATSVPGDVNAPTPRLGSGIASVVGGAIVENFSSGAANGGSSDPVTTSPPNFAWQTRGYPNQGSNDKTAGVQFMTSTFGLQDISVEYDLRHSNTSSRYEQFQYTTDGVNWIDFNAPSAGATGDTWFNNRAFNLSSIAAVENNSNFGIRVVSTFAPSTTQYQASNGASTYAGGVAGGSWRFDMVQIFANSFAPFVWTNAAGGDFHTAGNWSTTQVPTSNDPSVFNLASAGYTVTTSQDIETSSLNIRNDNVTLDLGAHTWSMPHDNTLVMFVGREFGDTGKLTLHSGTLVTGRTVIGNADHATGELMVDGPDAHFSVVDSALFAGGNGSSKGTVEIKNGGKLSLTGDEEPFFYIAPQPDTQGYVTVDGIGSSLESDQAIAVGERGDGHLFVTNGAHVAAPDLLYIGGTDVAPSASAMGEMIVTSGATASTGLVAVGWGANGIGGRGSLGIGIGSVVNSSKDSLSGISGTIGSSEPNAQGSVSVSGAGSKWLQDGILNVGSAGTGKLVISDHGYVECRDAQVGRAATAAGSVRINQDGLWKIQDRLIVGGSFDADGGFGDILMIAGSRIEVGHRLSIGSHGDVRLLVEFDLGTELGGSIEVGNIGSAAAAGVLKIGANGTLDGNGLVEGTVQNSAGIVSPGMATGRLQILGDFVQETGGKLVVDIGGTTPNTQFDVLEAITHFELPATGTAVLAGELEVRLTDLGGGTFVPAIGNSFDILKAAHGISGTFGTLDLPTLNVGLGWNITYLPTIVRLAVIQSSTIPGDYNGNGIVDTADYTVWRDTLGQTGAGLAADGNGNGMIDTGDYTVWKAHFGQTAGSGAGLASADTLSTAVPEPATAVMLILAAAGMCGRRHRTEPPVSKPVDA